MIQKAVYCTKCDFLHRFDPAKESPPKKCPKGHGPLKKHAHGVRHGTR